MNVITRLREYTGRYLTPLGNGIMGGKEIMDVLFGVMSLLVAIIWLGTGLLWFRYMKKLPVFTHTEGASSLAIYPSLSIIIPACNEEASIDKAIRQIITQDYPNLEVIVVNDRSTDQTGAILRNLKVQFPQLKVVDICDLPQGWLGKNHAIYQGVKRATGEWLLFTDADIMFSPGSLRKAISYALEHSLDHLTIAPDNLHESVLYRAFIAYFIFSATFMAMFTKSMGTGAFNLLKRSVYQEIGGYEAIALQPIDDMSLGKQVVKRGYKQGFGFSKGFITLKWYENLLAMLKGMEKNLFANFNYNIFITIGTCFSLLLIHVYPYVGLFFGMFWSKVLCAFSVLIIFAVYNYLTKYLDTSRSYVLIHPLSTLLFIGAIINSTVKTLSHGGIEWRGTIYPLKALKKHNT